MGVGGARAKKKHGAKTGGKRGRFHKAVVFLPLQNAKKYVILSKTRQRGLLHGREI
jgi:hypothetical protein